MAVRFTALALGALFLSPMMSDAQGRNTVILEVGNDGRQRHRQGPPPLPASATATASATALPGYDVHHNKAVAGFTLADNSLTLDNQSPPIHADLWYQNLDDCAQFCNNHPECAGFVDTPKVERCVFKLDVTAVYGERHDDGLRYGIRSRKNKNLYVKAASNAAVPLWSPLGPGRCLPLDDSGAGGFNVKDRAECEHKAIENGATVYQWSRFPREGRFGTMCPDNPRERDCTSMCAMCTATAKVVPGDYYYYYQPLKYPWTIYARAEHHTSSSLASSNKAKRKQSASEAANILLEDSSALMRRAPSASRLAAEE